MVDDQQATPTAEGQTQPAPMPSAEQQVPEVASPEIASSQEVSTQIASTEGNLPDDTRERTKREFEKLKTQLAQEREQRMRYQQMFATPQPQPTNQLPDYYNPETGEVDVLKLEQRNRSLEQQLHQLSGTVQSITAKEQQQQEEETYKAYPELDPNTGKFNQALHRAVTGYLTDAYLRGENPTFKQAADAINSLRAKEIAQAEVKGAEQALQQLSTKEQASLEAIGRSDKRQEVAANVEALSLRSRRGDMSAVAERLARLSSVGK